MKQFFEDYCNVKKIVCAKREYRRQMARVEALPPEYQYVFRKIQGQLWQFAAGPGYDMMQAHQELLDLVEEGAAAGRGVLEITGRDVAAFVEELLRQLRTWPEDWRRKLNRDIWRHVGDGKNGERNFEAGN